MLHPLTVAAQRVALDQEHQRFGPDTVQAKPFTDGEGVEGEPCELVQIKS